MLRLTPTHAAASTHFPAAVPSQVGVRVGLRELVTSFAVSLAGHVVGSVRHTVRLILCICSVFEVFQAVIRRYPVFVAYLARIIASERVHHQPMNQPPAPSTAAIAIQPYCPVSLFRRELSENASLSHEFPAPVMAQPCLRAHATTVGNLIVHIPRNINPTFHGSMLYGGVS